MRNRFRRRFRARRRTLGLWPRYSKTHEYRLRSGLKHTEVVRVHYVTRLHYKLHKDVADKDCYTATSYPKMLFDKQLKNDIERLSNDYGKIKLTKVVAYHAFSLDFEYVENDADEEKWAYGYSKPSKYWIDAYNYDGGAEKIPCKMNYVMSKHMRFRPLRKTFWKKKNVWRFFPKKYVDVAEGKKDMDWDTMLKASEGMESRDYKKVWICGPLSPSVYDIQDMHHHFHISVRSYYYYIFKCTDKRAKSFEYVLGDSNEIRTFTQGAGGKHNLPFARDQITNIQVTPRVYEFGRPPTFIPTGEKNPKIIPYEERDS